MFIKNAEQTLSTIATPSQIRVAPQPIVADEPNLVSLPPLISCLTGSKKEELKKLYREKIVDERGEIYPEWAALPLPELADSELIGIQSGIFTPFLWEFGSGRSLSFSLGRLHQKLFDVQKEYGFDVIYIRAIGDYVTHILCEGKDYPSRVEMSLKTSFSKEKEEQEPAALGEKENDKVEASVSAPPLTLRTFIRYGSSIENFRLVVAAAITKLYLEQHIEPSLWPLLEEGVYQEIVAKLSTYPLISTKENVFALFPFSQGINWVAAFKLARTHVFTSDDLYIPVESLITDSQGLSDLPVPQSNEGKALSSYYHSRLRLIKANDAHTIDERGWLKYLFLLLSGGNSAQKGLEEQLSAKINKNRIGIDVIKGAAKLENNPETLFLFLYTLELKGIRKIDEKTMANLWQKYADFLEVKLHNPVLLKLLHFQKQKIPLSIQTAFLITAGLFSATDPLFSSSHLSFEIGTRDFEQPTLECHFGSNVLSLPFNVSEAVSTLVDCFEKQKEIWDAIHADGEQLFFLLASTTADPIHPKFVEGLSLAALEKQIDTLLNQPTPLFKFFALLFSFRLAHLSEKKKFKLAFQHFLSLGHLNKKRVVRSLFANVLGVNLDKKAEHQGSAFLAFSLNLLSQLTYSQPGSSLTILSHLKQHNYLEKSEPDVIAELISCLNPLKDKTQLSLEHERLITEVGEFLGRLDLPFLIGGEKESIAHTKTYFWLCGKLNQAGLAEVALRLFLSAAEKKWICLANYTCSAEEMALFTSLLAQSLPEKVGKEESLSFVAEFLTQLKLFLVMVPGEEATKQQAVVSLITWLEKNKVSLPPPQKELLSFIFADSFEIIELESTKRSLMILVLAQSLPLPQNASFKNGWLKCLKNALDSAEMPFSQIESCYAWGAKGGYSDSEIEREIEKQHKKSKRSEFSERSSHLMQNEHPSAEELTKLALDYQEGKKKGILKVEEEIKILCYLSCHSKSDSIYHTTQPKQIRAKRNPSRSKQGSASPVSATGHLANLIDALSDLQTLNRLDESVRKEIMTSLLTLMGRNMIRLTSGHKQILSTVFSQLHYLCDSQELALSFLRRTSDYHLILAKEEEIKSFWLSTLKKFHAEESEIEETERIYAAGKKWGACDVEFEKNLNASKSLKAGQAYVSFLDSCLEKKLDEKELKAALEKFKKGCEQQVFNPEENRRYLQFFFISLPNESWVFSHFLEMQRQKKDLSQIDEINRRPTLLSLMTSLSGSAVTLQKEHKDVVCQIFATYYGLLKNETEKREFVRLSISRNITLGNSEAVHKFWIEILQVWLAEIRLSESLKEIGTIERYYLEGVKKGFVDDDLHFAIVKLRAESSLENGGTPRTEWMEVMIRNYPARIDLSTLSALLSEFVATKSLGEAACVQLFTLLGNEASCFYLTALKNWFSSHPKEGRVILKYYLEGKKQGWEEQQFYLTLIKLQIEAAQNTKSIPKLEWVETLLDNYPELVDKITISDILLKYISCKGINPSEFCKVLDKIGIKDGLIFDIVLTNFILAHSIEKMPRAHLNIFARWLLETKAFIDCKNQSLLAHCVVSTIKSIREIKEASSEEKRLLMGFSEKYFDLLRSSITEYFWLDCMNHRLEFNDERTYTYFRKVFSHHLIKDKFIGRRMYESLFEYLANNEDERILEFLAELEKIKSYFEGNHILLQSAFFTYSYLIIASCKVLTTQCRREGFNDKDLAAKQQIEQLVLVRHELKIAYENLTSSKEVDIKSYNYVIGKVDLEFALFLLSTRSVGYWDMSIRIIQRIVRQPAFFENYAVPTWRIFACLGEIDAPYLPVFDDLLIQYAALAGNIYENNIDYQKIYNYFLSHKTTHRMFFAIRSWRAKLNFTLIDQPDKKLNILQSIWDDFLLLLAEAKNMEKTDKEGKEKEAGVSGKQVFHEALNAFGDFVRVFNGILPDQFLSSYIPIIIKDYLVYMDTEHVSLLKAVIELALENRHLTQPDGTSLFETVRLGIIALARLNLPLFKEYEDRYWNLMCYTPELDAEFLASLRVLHLEGLVLDAANYNYPEVFLAPVRAHLKDYVPVSAAERDEFARVKSLLKQADNREKEKEKSYT